MNYKNSGEIIYQTKDYKGFIFTDWNRGVGNARVARMVESIKTFGWLPEPVLVNEKFEIIDGQSRVKALEKCGLPVQFVIKRNIGQEECQALNRFQKNWGTLDYISSYASLNNDDYMWLKSLIQDYKSLGVSVVCMVAVSGQVNICDCGSYAKVISSGLLKVPKEKRTEIEDACFYLTRFLDVIKKLKGRRDRFFYAINFLYRLESVDNERLCRVVNSARYDIKSPPGTVEGWLEMFDELYNQNRRKADHIDFQHEYRFAA